MLENFTNESLLNAIEYGYREPAGFTNRLVLPFSGNPLHSGHINLMLHSINNYGRIVNQNRPTAFQANYINLSPAFELSKTNCDKPEISDLAIKVRVGTITRAGFNVIVTNHPTFTQKNLLFRQSRFILGFDTLTRMLDLKHYYGSRELLLRNLTEGQNDYLIFPRGFNTKAMYEEAVEEEMNRFSDKPEFIARCIFVPFDSFKQNDISSTQLRSQIKEFSE